MKITLRRSGDRGFFDFGWLRTHHTFSFGDYHDPQYMRFCTLRVINQDIVLPEHGFDTHFHQDMEIITYVLSGAVTHQDTMGNKGVVHAGEIQCMSAGSGVKHSEHNRSATEILELLQIWIFPHKTGLPPSYQQQTYDRSMAGLQLLAAPKDSGGLVSIHQDAKLFRVKFDQAEEQLNYPISPQRHIWVQMIFGQATVNEQLLFPGDGIGIEQATMLTIVSKSPIELLLFDL